MLRPKFRGLVWTRDDEAAFAKWRRAVCIFYGCVALLLFVGWGVHQLVSSPRGDAAVAHVPAAQRAPDIVPAALHR